MAPGGGKNLGGPCGGGPCGGGPGGKLAEAGPEREGDAGGSAAPSCGGSDESDDWAPGWLSPDGSG